jgi:hypothetical protein
VYEFTKQPFPEGELYAGKMVLIPDVFFVKMDIVFLKNYFVFFLKRQFMMTWIQ